MIKEIEDLYITNDEISEALADCQWEITEDTTVEEYANLVALLLKVDPHRVLNIIMNESPDKITPTMKMYDLLGWEND